MKKMIMFALLAAIVAGQAQIAHAKRENKPEALKAEEAKKNQEQAAKDVKSAEAVKPENVKEAIEKMEFLTESQKADLKDLTKDPSSNLAKDAAAIYSNILAGKDVRMNKALLEGMANLKKVTLKNVGREELGAITNPVQKAEGSYVYLIKAAKKAGEWDAITKENLTYLIEQSNAYQKNGKSIGEATIEANKDLEANKKVKLNLDDVFKIC